MMTSCNRTKIIAANLFLKDIESANVDDIQRLIDRVSHFWGWIVGAFTGIVAAMAAWRKHGRRIHRTVVLSDRIHEHFGEDAGGKVVEELGRRSKDIVLGEVRQQFLEQRLGISLYVCTSSGSCEYASEAFADLFGLERAEMLGNGWLKAVNMSERQKVMEFWEYAVAHNMPYDYEYHIVNQDSGEKIRVITRAFPVSSRSGQMLCYVGMVERVLDAGINP